jgi:phosphatidylinositol phospholipase C epsilon
MHSLSDTLLTKDPSTEYREAVGRALDIPTSKVVPFFGGFLRELKAIVTGVPSVIVLPADDSQSLEVHLFLSLCMSINDNIKKVQK